MNAAVLLALETSPGGRLRDNNAMQSSLIRRVFYAISPGKAKLAITGLVASLALVSVVVASAASTSKTLSTNFTLVNLTNGANTANISYYKPDGSQWRTPEVKTFTTLGEQAIDRQYTDAALSAGSGSVVVGGQGALGAVVQIRALNQTPTSGAYSGATVAHPASTFHWSPTRVLRPKARPTRRSSFRTRAALPPTSPST